jgi:hypothetical protein
MAKMGSNPVPTQRPEFLKAEGIEKIPVPILPLRKWIIVSKFLKIIDR